MSEKISLDSSVFRTMLYDIFICIFEHNSIFINNSFVYLL